MLELAVKSLLAYLLGSLAGALVLGLALGVDIRREGSGNAGATNALRTRGPLFALGVLLIDLGKGVMGAAWVPALGWPAADAEVARSWLAVACAGAVVVGHVYPVWFGFRGGKGAATLIGALAGLAPLYVLPVLLLWLLVLYGTGYVGLSTMVAATSFPLWLVAGAGAGYGPSGVRFVALFSFGLFAALLTVFTHRANLVRLRAGTESRARRFVRPGLRP